jgi:hypothetical protein
MGAFLLATGLIVIYSISALHFGTARAQTDVVFAGALHLLRNPFIALCIVCFGWGIMQVLRLNRLVLGFLAGGIAYGLYLLVWGKIYSMLITGGEGTVDILEYSLLFTLVFGSILAAIGIFFYERSVEV